MSDVLLDVDSINTYYGDSHILRDLSISVDRHDVVSILGRNGMGKTTLLNSIMGNVTVESGITTYDGDDVTNLPVHGRSRRGLSLVPQERRIFPNLTVQENLDISNMEDGMYSLSEVYDLFPRLKNRLNQSGYSLSGGEQQMLAVARALLQRTECLLLDEPFEGLAPMIVEDIANRLREISAQDVTVVIVGQQIDETLDLANHSYIIEDGRIVYDDAADALKTDTVSQQRFLGVG